MKAELYLEDDLCGALSQEIRCERNLVIFEGTRQPLDKAPPVGWDWRRDPPARQFCIMQDEFWILIVVERVGDTLRVDIPCNSDLDAEFLELVGRFVCDFAAMSGLPAGAIAVITPENDDGLAAELKNRIERNGEPKLM